MKQTSSLRRNTALPLLGLAFLLSAQITFAQNSLQPRYKKAAYGNEFVTLQNETIRLDMFKRVDGWGWGELHTADGKYLGILEHLGEIMMRDQDIPVHHDPAVVKNSFPKNVLYRLAFCKSVAITHSSLLI